MTKTELVRLEDTNGALWRLVLYEDKEPGAVSRVMLECLYSKDIVGYVPIKKVTEDPAEIGLVRRGRGVVMLDDGKATAALVALMQEHGATPRPPSSLLEGLSRLGAVPNEPEVFEPDVPCHQRRNLLEFSDELEGCAKLASTGMWVAMIRACGPGAVMTGASTDPVWVCESVSREDLLYILMMQPQAGGQIARKLREACLLLQDLSKAALAVRGEIDHLSNPKHRTASLRDRLDMFDRWMVVLGLRCAAFPSIQVPELDVPAELSDRPPSSREPMSRQAAVVLAKKARNASLGLEVDPSDSYSVSSWVVDAIIEASR
jgi:hypothetical protein